MLVSLPSLFQKRTVETTRLGTQASAGCENPFREESEVGKRGQQYQPAISKPNRVRMSSLNAGPMKLEPLRASQHHSAFSAEGMILPHEMS